MELANEHSVDLIKIDTKINKSIPGQLSVFIVPTVLIIYKDREMLRESRFIDFVKMEASLNYILDLDKEN